jgi:hypothetical protein
MARGRLISRSLGSSRKYHELLRLGGRLGEFCQVLFPLIVVSTDDFGRMAGDAFTIKNAVLPTSRRPEADFDRALDVMHTADLITRYTVDGSIYLQVNKFDEHQPNLHKRTRSHFPESPGISGKFRTNLTELNRTEPKGTHNRASAAPFEVFWSAYPRKASKLKAQKEWEKRQPDPDLLAVMLRALERQKQTPAWQAEKGRYIPHPDTWLRNARWTDEDTADLQGEAHACHHEPPCADHWAHHRLVDAEATGDNALIASVLRLNDRKAATA